MIVKIRRFIKLEPFKKLRIFQMLEAILIDGKRRDFNGLKGFMLDYAKEYLLSDLSSGRLPQWYSSEKKAFESINLILKESERRELSLEEREWILQLRQLKKEIESFDPKKYASLDEGEKAMFAMREGSKLAIILNSLVRGYQNPLRASAKTDTDLLKYHYERNIYPFTKSPDGIETPSVYIPSIKPKSE